MLAVLPNHANLARNTVVVMPLNSPVHVSKHVAFAIEFRQNNGGEGRQEEFSEVDG